MKKQIQKLTPKKFREEREVLGLTQTELAEAMSLPKKSGQRRICAYETGERKIPGPIQLLLRYIVRYGRIDP